MSELSPATFAIIERLSREFPILEGHWSRGTGGADVNLIIAVLYNALHDARQSARYESKPRPADCRNRLRDEGKPYPRSGCLVCKDGGLRGCPYERRTPPSDKEQ